MSESGNITESAGTVSYNSFTGSHIGLCNEDLHVGTLVSLTGTMDHIKLNLDSEPIYFVTPSQQANDSKILGAYLHPLDKEGFQNKIKGELKAIMAVGNGIMWIAENGEDIEIGDYLISSSVKGHAMKDNGEFEKAYIVGRAAEAIRWSEIVDKPNGKKHKRISVFFENFIIDHSSKRNKDQIEELKARLGILESQVSQFERMMNIFSLQVNNQQK